MAIFKLNKLGKISCLFGVPAFISCLLAAHSQQYRVSDLENPMLSPVVNFILKPINYLERFIFQIEAPVEPTMAPLGMSYIFEHEAIIAFFIFGSVLSIVALYYSIRAVEKDEFSIWYANGAFLSILALVLANAYAGILAALVILTLVLKIRQKIKTKM